MLRVALNRPRDVATTVRYVLGADADPATADADAADHDGMDGEVTITPGATEAGIGIAIRDDTDIEPPRESFTVTLQATEPQLQDFGLGIAAVRVTIDEGVCDRTRQVRNALRRSLPCAKRCPRRTWRRGRSWISRTGMWRHCRSTICPASPV